MPGEVCRCVCVWVCMCEPVTMRSSRGRIEAKSWSIHVVNAAHELFEGRVQDTMIKHLRPHAGFSPTAGHALVPC